MSFVLPSSSAAYARVGIETGVQAADAHRLILMLFDGALVAIGQSIAAMQAGNIRVKGESVSKAIQIVEEGLKASLDDRAGGKAGAELADKLRALYDYITQRMLFASMRNRPEGLEEATRLLRQLRDAWEQIR
ncbi:MAG: flagellar export chaperone FliS [Betaproteobacteria bacterium]|nr:flagellar export chaperone FliS [Betaproteobacteria bacterium]